MKDNSINERLETCTNFFDPIKRSKLKTFESVNQIVLAKASDKKLTDYKRERNLAFQLLVQAQYLDEKVNVKLLMSLILTLVLLRIETLSKREHYPVKNLLLSEKQGKNYTLH